MTRTTDGLVSRRRFRFAVALLGVSLLSVCGTAQGLTVANGYRAHKYATGFKFSHRDRWGPFGVAFDQSDNLYVADTINGNIYRFQPGGGKVSSATRLTLKRIPGIIAGLAVSKSGSVYLARRIPGDIVKINPGTGRIVRTVAKVKCPLGLAIDPIIGDLFTSQDFCGNKIFRVSHFQHHRGRVRTFARAPRVDGLAFDKHGTMYAASNGTVIKIQGTHTRHPGRISTFASVPNADGIAFSVDSRKHPSGVVVNRNDGIVTQANFGTSPPSETNLFTHGSRGDFAAVNSRGCLYVTQTASVVQVRGPGSTCGFEPTTRGRVPRPGVAVSTLAGPQHGAACKPIRSIIVRLSQRGRVRLRSATIYVNHKRVKRIRGNAVTAPIKLSSLPHGSFRIKVVARTTKGLKLTSVKRYGGCRRGHRH